jgi:hypothetical protein
MIAATTRWLNDNTTLVAALASLVIGRMKEAARPSIASATKAGRGRRAHRRQAAASTVPDSAPSSSAAQAMFSMGMRAK